MDSVFGTREPRAHKRPITGDGVKKGEPSMTPAQRVRTFPGPVTEVSLSTGRTLAAPGMVLEKS